MQLVRSCRVHELFFLPVLVVLFLWLFAKNGARKGFHELRRDFLVRVAEQQRQSLEIAFSGTHTYRAARPDDWAGMNRAFFADATTAFEREGFVVLGDIIDETMVEAFASMRHVMRVMVGDGGRVRVAIMQMRVLGVARLLQLVGVGARRMTFVECVSELDGVARFVSTASTLGSSRMSMPDEVERDQLAPTTAPAAVLARHRERLAVKDRAPFVVMEDMAAVLQSVQRGNVVIARYREGVGPMTADELTALRGRRLDDAERAFLAAVRRESG